MPMVNASIALLQTIKCAIAVQLPIAGATEGETTTQISVERGCLCLDIRSTSLTELHFKSNTHHSHQQQHTHQQSLEKGAAPTWRRLGERLLLLPWRSTLETQGLDWQATRCSSPPWATSRDAATHWWAGRRYAGCRVTVTTPKPTMWLMLSGPSWAWTLWSSRWSSITRSSTW